MSDIRNHFEELVKNTLERFDAGEISEGDLRVLCRPLELSTQSPDSIIVEVKEQPRARFNGEWNAAYQEIFSQQVEDRLLLDRNQAEWIKERIDAKYIGELTLFTFWEKSSKKSTVAASILATMRELKISQFIGKKTPWIPPYHSDAELIRNLQQSEPTRSFHYGSRAAWKLVHEQKDQAPYYIRMSLPALRTLNLWPGIHIEYWLDEDGNFNPNKTSE